jgi:hypothetical protein
MGTTAPISVRRHRRRVGEVIVTAAVAVVLIAIHLMFFFWPFRYRQVHPLLERTFRSKVEVTKYHRTYFPHPGFVAEGVTFYRHGDKQIPPLATISRMTVVGTWTTLLFHPHRLYEIELEGLHVQIPPPGTTARGMDFDQGVIDSSQSKMQIQTIVADRTTLDFLRRGRSPLRFEFAALQVHDVQANRPLTFAARVETAEPRGLVLANGSLGPFRTSAYGATPMQGTYSLVEGNLQGIDGLSGNVHASGHFSGIFSKIEVAGNASIPDFHAGKAHAVRLDSAYRLAVNGNSGDVDIEDAQLRTANSLITATGSVTGSPKKVAVTFATRNSRVEDLLTMVSQTPPAVVGLVSFNASAEFGGGPGKFLQRLALKGQASVDQLRFVNGGTQGKMDAFSAREVKPSEGSAKADPNDVPPEVFVAASTHTQFEAGVARFPDIAVTLPGAQARLQGTFNLLSTQIHLIGTASLQRSLSHATTGWKSVLLKPLAPFFHHKDVGAVVSIAVTGTAHHPKVGQNVLHDK